MIQSCRVSPSYGTQVFKQVAPTFSGKTSSVWDEISKVSTLSMGKDDAKDDPVLASAIDKLYDMVIKEKKELPTEKVFETAEKTIYLPTNNKDGSPGKHDTIVFNKRIKLDENTYVFLGINNKVYRVLDEGTIMHAPEAAIKIVDAKGNSKTKQDAYFTWTAGGRPKYGIIGKYVPIHDYYSDRLVKIAEKLCKE